jgi:hypothetical protein
MARKKEYFTSRYWSQSRKTFLKFACNQDFLKEVNTSTSKRFIGLAP